MNARATDAVGSGRAGSGVRVDPAINRVVIAAASGHDARTFASCFD
jgi:hypothetical protein